MRVTLLMVFFIWAGLYLLNYPYPMGDDLYFGGTAINLAQGKGYANPYITCYGAHEHFYAYVPLHAYILAAWLKLFGISRDSLALLQCAAGAAASLALIGLIGNRKRKVFGAVILSLFLATILAGLGLRPDFLGLALLLGGALILRVRSLWAWTLCSFALALTVICTPNFAILVPVVFLSALSVRSELVWPPQRITLFRVGASLAAAAVVFILFLAMIDFQLSSFLAVFMAEGKRNQYGWYLVFLEHRDRNIARICLSLTVTFLALLAAKARPELFEIRVSSGAIVAFLAGALGLILVYFSSMNGRLWLDSYLSLVIFWLILHLKGSDFRVCGVAAIIFIFAVFNYRARIVQLAAVPFRAPQFYQPEIKARIEAAHANQVYIDTFALASIYNYQIPANTVDYFFGFPKPITSTKEVPPHSLLVVSPAYLSNDLVPSAPALFGKVPPDMTRNPYQFVLIKIP
jgi:hypothetical protein